MDSQYVDQYIRRKKGTLFLGQVAGERLQQAVRSATASGQQQPQRGGPAYEHVHQSYTTYADGSAAGGASAPSVESSMALIGQVQNFVDRTDALNLQMVAAEDKIINLTRLLKMQQITMDEREEAHRREVADLKGHMARLEDGLAGLRDALAPANIAAIARAVATEELAVYRNESENIWHGRKQQLASKTDVQQSCQAIQDSSQQQFTELRQSIQQVSQRVQSIVHEPRETNASLSDRQSDVVRRMIDDQAKMSQLVMKEFLMQELRNEARRVDDMVFPKSAGDELVKRLAGFEEHSASIESGLQEFITAFKEHSRQHATKSEETAQALRELANIQEETRKAVATEIDGTKQWAVRNLQRIKRHLDLNQADIQALREAHAASVEHVAVLQRTQSEEHERLCALLEQKSKEAESLGELIDKEIVGIRRLAQEHRAGVDETAAELQGNLAARSKARSERLSALTRDMQGIASGTATEGGSRGASIRASSASYRGAFVGGANRGGGAPVVDDLELS